jgi:hypothetical protein
VSDRVEGRLVVGRLTLAGLLVALVGLRRRSPLAIVLGGILAGAGLKLHAGEAETPADAGSTPA